MNRICKNITMFLAAFGLFFVLGFSSFAQGTTSISVSKASPAVGDSTTVTVQASQSGTVTVKYTSSLLTFSSCNASGYSAQNNTVTFSGTEGSIVFTAAGEGTASIIVSSSNCAGSSTTISIGASASQTAEAETVEETSETAETETAGETVAEDAASDDTSAVAAESGSGSLNADGGFDIDGVSYVVSERYADNEIPDGFSKTSLTIASGTYSELTNGSVTIIYLKPADNTAGSGVFYLYNAEAGTVSPFLMVGSADNYVILSETTDDTMSGLTATTVEVTGGSYSGYTTDGSEYFYVYGTNNSGYTGWFLYDATYKTVSRVDTSLMSQTTEDTDTTAAVSYDTNDDQTEKLSSYRRIISFLIVLAVILVFAVINLALKIRRDGDDDFDFDPSEDDQDGIEDSDQEAKPAKKRRSRKDDGDVFARTPDKPAFKIPRSIVFADPDSVKEDAEESEDFEEETEEYIPEQPSDYSDDYEEGYDEDDYQDDFDEDYEDDEEDYEDEDDYPEDSYSDDNDSDDDDGLQLMDLNDL